MTMGVVAPSIHSKPSMTDIDNKAIFAPLEAHMRSEEEYHDIDIYQLIGDYAVVAPHVARAIAFHARDIIQEHGSDHMTYTDLVVGIWYRAFFSPTHAPLYGTQQMVHDPVALANFVKYVIDPNSVKEEDVVIKAKPHHH